MKPYDTNYEPTTEGVHEIPWLEYRRVRALNSSLLKYGAMSMLHLQTQRDAPMDEPTPAMNVGQAFHLLTLEPERFEDEFYVEPMEVNRRSKEYRELKDTMAKRGLLMLKHEDYINVQAMIARLRSKAAPMNLLSEGWPERTILWRDPVYGFWCKGRIDFINVDQRIVDLKKTRSAAYEGFKRSIWNYNYNWQAYWYSKGLKVATGDTYGPFFWIAWEDQPPHEGRVFEADASAMAQAEDDIEPILKAYATALDTGIYEGYPDEVAYIGQERSFWPDEDDDEGWLEKALNTKMRAR